MTGRVYLRLLAREARGSRGRLLFFVLCLAIGVAAVVAVAGFSASLRQGLRREARQLLAADLRLSGHRPAPPEVEAALAAEPGVERTRLTEMVTVALAPEGTAQAGRSQLVELRAVDGTFPFYGQIALRPEQPLAELLARGGAVAAPELLTRLGLAIGDPIQVGGRRFTIRGVVESEPDRLSRAFALGPRLYLAGESLAATGLVGLGSRIDYRLLVRLPEGSPPDRVEALAARLRALLPEPSFYRLETFAEGQPELRRGVDRAERFLGLVALLALLIGGIGVAQTVRAWVQSRLDAIAVWKALGGRPREAIALYLGQTALLALAGSVAGLAGGWGIERLLPALLGNLVPRLPLAPLAFSTALHGLGLGLGVALLFALPPLLGALRVPTARVLRRSSEPLPASRATVALLGGALALGVAGLATAQARSLALGFAFAAGLAAATGLLALAARLLVSAVRRLPRLRLPLAPRYGLAALGRPGAPTTASLVALGLGAMVVVGLLTVERGLVDRLAADLPSSAPTAFLIDIQPDQWAGVEEELARAHAQQVDSVPVVMARLAAVDGRPVRELAAAAEKGRDGAGDGDEGPRERRWRLTREQRLTYLDRLPADNTVTAGALWSDPERAEVSVEEEFARGLGIGVGSTLTFDVQGVPIELAVTSLRKVRWESFGINFFLVVEPGVLERAPQLRLAAVRLPEGGEATLQDALAARYPNITLFAIRDVLAKVSAVLERIGLGVRFLGGFTILAGLAILAGSIAAGAALRAREVALGKALGMTRAQVALLFATESAVVGALAGLLGAIAGSALGATVLERGMEIGWRPEPAIPLVALVAMSLLAAGTGLVTSWKPLRERPIVALRGAD